MPGWHKSTEQLRKDGKIAILGITQEQHPNRCRLFSQWHKFDWPILHDPINLTGATAVPIVVAIDETGIVRSTRPTPAWLADFVNEPAASTSNESPAPPKPPALAELHKLAKEQGTAKAWRALGDAAVLWGGDSKLNLAVSAYQAATKEDPKDPVSEFRLGVAFRKRFESDASDEDDFQRASEHWERALALNPNQYIYRRRIQQYGPRLIKPYPFYDWVDGAREAIIARGEVPVQLAVEPSGAEIARPARAFSTSGKAQESPDPNGKINRDRTQLIKTSTTVVPGTIKPGESTRVHLRFEPSGSAHWNNESEPLVVWLEVPEGWKLESSLLTAPVADQPESTEVRTVEVEVQSPTNATGAATLNGYALYYVCEEADGTCLYLRHDLECKVTIQNQ